ncbi:MAG: alpha/beta fold hydrolase [Actinomycetota bacterium]|nr:alpha/beta hydrolase [Actinomycetota bacterium]
MLLEGPDCKLWVKVSGDGAPVTVFAHGLTSSSADISDIGSRVGGTRVFFDFRGHGRSESPPERSGYGLDAMMRDFDYIATTFGAHNALGVSLGASVITRLIARQPARFDRIVLVIPARLDGGEPAADEYLAMADALESRRAEDIAADVLLREAVANLIARAPVWKDRLRKQVMAMNATGTPRALRAAAGGPPPLSEATALRSVAVPVLIAAHEGDPSHDAAVARRLADLLPAAELRVWPNVLEMLDDMAAFSEFIAAFLSRDPAVVVVP